MISQSMLHDIPVFRLMVGDNTADICAQTGANCIRLKLGKADVYRTPKDFETLLTSPNVYGEPLLFPPNRINHGAYSFNNRVYRFPINEPSRGHHIHGILSGTPFTMAKTREKPDQARVEFTFEATKEHPYLDFPHPFLVTRTYILDNDSLFQRTRIKNTGGTPMPVGVGFHTTLNTQFLLDINTDALRLTLPVRNEIMLDRTTIIPTGQRRETPLGKALRTEGIKPQGDKISAHFERSEKMTVRLLDTASRCAINYEVSPTLGFFMLWNGDGTQGFVCPEPQSWIVDAPNQSKEEAHSGFRALSPRDELEVWTRVSISL